jgi:hypothetical protein
MEKLNLPHCRIKWKNKMYHTAFITTMWYILFFHLFRRCGTFCFPIYSDNVVHFVFPFIPTMWYILFSHLFQQCDTFCFPIYSNNVVHFVFPFIPNVPHCRNKWKNKMYHIVGINGKTKCTTLSE